MDYAVAELEQELEAQPSRSGPTKYSWADPKVRRATIGAAVIILLATVTMWWYLSGRVSTDDAQVDGHIIPVASKVYGNIAEVLVTDNQHVEAGQVIARIDPRDYQAKLDQARAALALAESQARGADTSVPLTDATTASGASAAAANLAMAEADYQRAASAYAQVSSSELAAARALVAAREAANDKAQADLARMTPLAAKAEISKLQFDAYRAAARVAESELAAAREKLAATEKEAEQRHAGMLAARSKIDAARAQLVAAQAGRKQVTIQAAQAASASAAVQQALANVQAAELQLSYTEIKAPVAGKVTKKTLQVGQVVQPGQSLLVVVPTEVWVTANFKETQLADVRPGQKAKVKVDMYGDTFTGRVDSIAHATGARLSLLPPENATGNFVKTVQRIPVKIVLDPLRADKVVLRPGMNVEATIITR